MAIDSKTTFPRAAWAADKKQDLRNAIDASVAATGQGPRNAGRMPPPSPRYGAPMPEPVFCVDVPKMRAYLRGTELPELGEQQPNLRGYKLQEIDDARPVDGPLREIYFNARGQFFLKVTPSGFAPPGVSTEPKWFGPGQLPEGVKLDSCDPLPPPAPRYGMPFPRPDVEIPPPSPRYGAPMPGDWK